MECLPAQQMTRFKDFGCLLVDKRFAADWLQGITDDPAPENGLNAADAVARTGAAGFGSVQHGRILHGSTLSPRPKDSAIRIPQVQPEVPISIHEIRKGLKTRAFDTRPAKEKQT